MGSAAPLLLMEATDKDMLIEENIDQCDAFCAVTNDDDINIMSSLMAKRLGVKQVITLIGKRAYVDLMHDSPSIDVVSATAGGYQYAPFPCKTSRYSPSA